MFCTLYNICMADILHFKVRFNELCRLIPEVATRAVSNILPAWRCTLDLAQKSNNPQQQIMLFFIFSYLCIIFVKYRLHLSIIFKQA